MFVDIFDKKLKFKTISLKKDESLFLQNSQADSLFFLEKGRIKLIRDTEDGKPLVIHIAYAQETFAEASMFASNYHCNAVSDTASIVRVYSKKDIKKYLENNNNAMMDLLSLYTKQVRGLRLLNEIKSINSAYDRVLTFLNSEADNNLEINFSYSLKDMSQKLGLAHETFYRTLKQLELDGKIVKNSNCIKIII